MYMIVILSHLHLWLSYYLLVILYYLENRSRRNYLIPAKPKVNFLTSPRKWKNIDEKTEQLFRYMKSIVMPLMFKSKKPTPCRNIIWTSIFCDSNGLLAEKNWHNQGKFGRATFILPNPNITTTKKNRMPHPRRWCSTHCGRIKLWN